MKTSNTLSSKSPAQHSRWTLLFGLCITAAVAGCSDADGYVTPVNLTDITGTVTLDGEPLAGATLSFIPETGTAGTGGFALTNDSGQFDAQHYSLEYGLEPGSYDVAFSRLQMPDGKPLPSGIDATDAGAIEGLPQHLVEIVPENHPYRVVVTGDSSDVSFELTSKRK